MRVRRIDPCQDQISKIPCIEVVICSSVHGDLDVSCMDVDGPGVYINVAVVTTKTSDDNSGRPIS